MGISRSRDRQSRREAPHLPGASSVDVTRFDGNGNAVERTNARNFVSGQAFDNLDRLETSTDADDGETNYTSGSGVGPS